MPETYRPINFEGGDQLKAFDKGFKNQHILSFQKNQRVISKL